MILLARIPLWCGEVLTFIASGAEDAICDVAFLGCGWIGFEGFGVG